jgi:pyruvate dehydrogenase E1 component
VGIGATAPIWSALAHRYVAGHFDVPVGGRQIALVGDAELDEGAVWEAIVDPTVPQLGEVLWVVDLNRQSLDRVVPDIAATRLARMFEAAGWNVEQVKYGSRLAERPELRARIDAMPNEEFQRLLRETDLAQLRTRLGDAARDVADEELRPLVRDLGGHDLGSLIDAYRAAEAVRDRPVGRLRLHDQGLALPDRGPPGQPLRAAQRRAVRGAGAELGTSADAPFAASRRARPRPSCAPRSPPGSSARRATTCRRRRPGRDLAAPQRPGVDPAGVRALLRRPLARRAGGRRAGRHRRARRRARRRTSAAGSTGSGSGSPGDAIDWFADDPDTLVRWRESDHGQHIELGIAEVNLVGLLGELGATWSRDGPAAAAGRHDLRPVRHARHEPWSFGIYAGGQSILVGTPSGVTLGPRAARTSRSSRRRSASSSPAA